MEDKEITGCQQTLFDAERIAVGAGPDVVRLSVGIEDVSDIIADVEQGLVKLG